MVFVCIIFDVLELLFFVVFVYDVEGCFCVVEVFNDFNV